MQREHVQRLRSETELVKGKVRNQAMTRGEYERTMEETMGLKTVCTKGEVEIRAADEETRIKEKAITQLTQEIAHASTFCNELLLTLKLQKPL